MYNRIRIIYVICLAIIIYTSFSLIELTISMILLAELGVSGGLQYSLRTTYPFALLIITLIVITIMCKKKYDGDKADFNLRNNYFIIGFILLISNLVSVFQLPATIKNFILMSTLRGSIPINYLMNTISNLILLIIQIVLSIILIIKDYKSKN